MAPAEDLEYGLIGRSGSLFQADLEDHAPDLAERIQGRRFLVVGGAGTVGQAVVKELLRYCPAAVHVVDISENALAELVRDIRSSPGEVRTDLQLFCVDAGDPEFSALVAAAGPYHHVLYLAALKHVRSEKDPFTLMRMVRVNVLDLLNTLAVTGSGGLLSFFSVSTDKASNPINAMGATKRAMESLLLVRAQGIPLTRVRLANVSFSSGSLPASFRERVIKRQPLAAPRDVRRYFITPTEAGQICLLATVLGADGDIFFPRRDAGLQMQSFVEMAERFLSSLGYRPRVCATEEEARGAVEECARRGEWPCWFTVTDTSGEKIEEEFVESSAWIDRDRFRGIGVIKTVNAPGPEHRAMLSARLETLLSSIRRCQSRGTWQRQELLEALHQAVPEFAHHETGRTLDAKM